MTGRTNELKLRVRALAYVLPALPELIFLVILIAVAIADPSVRTNWIFPVLLVLFGGLAVPRVMSLIHAVRRPWVITINANGVRWNHTNISVTWPEVAEIRVFVAHGWRRLVPHLPNRIILVTPQEASFAKRAKSRPIGTPIFLSQVDAEPGTITDALRQYTNAPVLS